MMHDVLVVVPTYMSHPARYRLFDQLWHDHAVARVVVIDNGNSFAVPKKKERMWSKIIVNYPGKNLNWLGACVLGTKFAKDFGLPYVALLNDDVRLSSQYFSGLKAAVSRDRKIKLATSLYDGQFCRAAVSHASQRNWRPAAEDIDVPYIDGTCMFMPLKTIHEIGTLDPSFGDPGWGADADYSYRVRQAGGRVIVTRRSMLWHKNGETAKVVYGSHEKWQKKGHEQMRRDLSRKYGPDYATILSL